MDYKLKVTLFDDLGGKQEMNICYSSPTPPKIEFNYLFQYIYSLLLK